MDNKTENKIAHLGFIETTIERMANNSASIKGWSMGIVAALLGIGIISGENINPYRLILFLCACLITIVMWWLDAFYLYQEKLYRDLYSIIRNIDDDNKIDFSMDARYKTIKGMKGKAVCYFSVLKNRTIIPFYLSQILVYFLFFILPIWIIR